MKPSLDTESPLFLYQLLRPELDTFLHLHKKIWTENKQKMQTQAKQNGAKLIGAKKKFTAYMTYEDVVILCRYILM